MNKATRPRTCGAEECERDHYARGYCLMHYRRAQKLEILKPRTGVDRFWERVDREADCWIWLGSTNGTGYGRIMIDRQLHYVHRFSYELANGPIPNGMVVDHICRTRSCVRPEHLRLATQKQNLENLSQRTSNKSGFRGVFFHKTAGRWRAEVKHFGVNHYLGYYDTPEEAHAVVSAWRREHFTHSIEG